MFIIHPDSKELQTIKKKKDITYPKYLLNI